MIRNFYSIAENVDSIISYLPIVSFIGYIDFQLLWNMIGGIRTQIKRYDVVFGAFNCSMVVYTIYFNVN